MVGLGNDIGHGKYKVLYVVGQAETSLISISLSIFYFTLKVLRALARSGVRVVKPDALGCIILQVKK